MASTVASGVGYLPNIYQNDDWRTITVHKLNSEGQRCEKEKFHKNSSIRWKSRQAISTA